MTFPLCEAEELTEWYYEDDLIYICDCLSCEVPMAVIKRHDVEPTEEERLRIARKCYSAAEPYSYSWRAEEILEAVPSLLRRTAIQCSVSPDIWISTETL